MPTSLRYIVFDIETSSDFLDGAFDPATLDLALVAIYDSETDSYDSFLKTDLPRLWPVLERSDALVGYNSDHFDIPILNRFYPGDLSRLKSIDLLKDVKKTLGRRLKLESLAQATLGRGKLGDGLQAMKWWKEGQVERVREYCLEDVRITKEIFEYARTYKKLKYKDLGQVKEVPIDTSEWEVESSQGLTYTLPF